MDISKKLSPSIDDTSTITMSPAVSLARFLHLSLYFLLKTGPKDEVEPKLEGVGPFCLQFMTGLRHSAARRSDATSTRNGRIASSTTRFREIIHKVHLLHLSSIFES